MASQSERVHPPFYPHAGTYADLLAWHLEYWGTREDGHTTINGQPWELLDFRLKAFATTAEAQTAARVGLGNWLATNKSPNSSPNEQNHRAIKIALFGTNPEFADWRDDLDQARERSAEGRNLRARTFPDPPPVTINLASSSGEGIPFRTPHFTGRDDEVRELANMLASGAQRAILIQGEPGIGKTELTKAIGHDKVIADHFGANRWFVRLEAAVDAEAMEIAIISALGCDPQYGFQAALSKLRGADSLLILNNLETPWLADQMLTVELLERLAMPGVSLIASMRGTAFVARPHWKPHLLDVLPLKYATDLLASIAGPWVRDDPFADIFLNQLGGLPLAIDLVARRAYGGTSLAPLLEEWLKIGTKFPKIPRVKEEPLTSLYRSIELAVGSCKEDSKTLYLFGVLGCLPAGLARHDLNALLKDDAFEAAELLKHVGLANERLERIDLLPPIREHARRNYSPSGDKADEWMNYFLGLAQQLNDNVGTPEGAKLLKRLQPEFNNVEQSLRRSVSKNPNDNTLPALNALKSLSIQGKVATGAFRKLLKEYKSAGNFFMELKCVISDAAIDVFRGRFAEAKIKLEHVLEICERGADFDENISAECHARLGVIAQIHADYEKMAWHLAQSSKIYEEYGNLHDLSMNNFYFGSSLMDRWDHEAAEEKLVDALRGFYKTGNLFGEASCVQHLGMLATRRLLFENALLFFQVSLNLFLSIGANYGEAICYLGIGEAYMHLEDYPAAEVHCKNASKIFEEIGYKIGEAGCAEALAHVTLKSRRFAESEIFHEKSRYIYNEIGDVAGELSCMISLANLYFAKGDLGESEAIYNDCLLICNIPHQNQALAQCMHGLADIARLREDNNNAKKLYISAIENYKISRNLMLQAQCFTRLGHLYFLEGKFDESKKNVQLALDIYEDHADVFDLDCVMICLSCQGDIALTEEDFNKARLLFTELHDIFEVLNNRDGKEYYQDRLDSLPRT